MKKISVIVPVFNTEEFLEDCLYSIVNQSYSNLEIIIINDGSTDNSQQIIDSFVEQDARITSYLFEGNNGMGVARNYGLQKATGDFIYFVDSDDFIPLDILQLLMNNIDEYPVISGKLKRTDKSENNNIEITEVSPIYYTKKRTKIFKNKSALNRLYRKDFLDQYNIRFSEEVAYFSDIAFIAEVLQHTSRIPYVKECVYYKRRRNDPINNASLMQQGKKEKIKALTFLYIKLKGNYEEDTLVSKYLDQQLLNYYRKSIVVYFKKEENIVDVFEDLARAMKKVDNRYLSNRSKLLKREIKPMRDNNLKLFKKVNNQHQMLRGFKKGFKSKRAFYLQIYRSVFTKLSLKNDLIIFESFLGRNYSDNPKYIYEHMVQNNMNYEFVWSFNETNKNIPGNAKQVKRFSLKYYYYMARAKYWVSNARIPKTLGKREGNIYLQTWHGTPLKTLVFDIKDIHSADPNHKKNFYIQSRRWDFLISPNQYSTDIFRRAFQFNNEMLEYGYPRNDILYSKNTTQDILSLKQQFNIPSNKKVILYAPTWRDNEFFEKGKYKFTLKLELDKLREELSDEYIIILRTHYHISNQLDISEYEGFAFDMSNYDDIAELYLITDILITDYSSVFFDFANLKRPILFYTYDLESYRDTIRGFYFDIEKEVPGPLLKTTESVIDSIKNIDQVQLEYQERYNEFYEKFCKWDDGNASKKVVDRVFKQEID
ncbi:CDP-glycerol:poly(glycerophosphate) glycerophosphotransferase [Paraliobacillus sp. PM-2]|uniref:bifunctional glycosyltransferase/CDP-glycerol:glycerophosphate glycerophosphotransferase n=1 Tax=Paraliobacillus sp. PM-2 TaxID=1462524 RepID=UPI00061B9CCD|nr:bifunctional glycosyltransferase family 2 protein/CDP-glycerol:glycerophosphate glycerophosphotransferase [Paraliobacillus sp. PM-2]CQR46198.1 CDP-glycerol:poly(glycerophosphate) glycerophosphotransferase [Paraliobacillus sp. PM-2]